nr:hypothetical protein Q903MT_gene1421 [Picea sitchensis]
MWLACFLLMSSNKWDNRVYYVVLWMENGMNSPFLLFKLAGIR